MFDFKDKTVLVTGGSRGIGKEIVKLFASHNANVVFTFVSPNTDVEAILKDVNASGNVIGIRANVSVMSECEELMSQVKEKFGTVDILVNNAGITKDNLFVRMSEQDFDDVIDVNLKGNFNMMKLCTRPMVKQKFGRIINISSVVALTGNKGQVNYVAAKAGVIGMTKSLAQEVGSKNVTVNAVAPGFIETDMTNKLPEEVVKNFINNIPLKRFGNVADIANSVLFLASEYANYITGQTLSVNGGLSM